MDALYLQLAPLPRHGNVVRHLYVLKDGGVLARGESSRFSNPCRDIGITCRVGPAAGTGGAAPQWELYDRPPRFGRVPRKRPFHGWAIGFLCSPLNTGIAVDVAPALRALQREISKEVHSAHVSLDCLVHAMDACIERLVSQGASSAREPFDARQFSLRTLQRRMKAVVGLGPKRWTALWRFDEALRRLASGDGSISDIAFAAGYSDQAHMTADFGRHTGISPGRMRTFAREFAGGDARRFLHHPALAARVRWLIANTQ